MDFPPGPFRPDTGAFTVVRVTTIHDTRHPMPLADEARAALRTATATTTTELLSRLHAGLEALPGGAAPQLVTQRGPSTGS